MTQQLYDIAGKNVYLSGPVTGLPMEGVIEAFDAARVRCELAGASYIYSPIKHVNHNASHEEAMLECLSNLVSRDVNDEFPYFDALVMLDRWNESRGARLEVEVARALGIDCVSIHAVGGGRE